MKYPVVKLFSMTAIASMLMMPMLAADAANRSPPSSSSVTAGGNCPAYPAIGEWAYGILCSDVRGAGLVAKSAPGPILGGIIVLDDGQTIGAEGKWLQADFGGDGRIDEVYYFKGGTELNLSIIGKPVVTLRSSLP